MGFIVCAFATLCEDTNVVQILDVLEVLFAATVWMISFEYDNCCLVKLTFLAVQF
jgi:hypothetical protein